MKRGLSIALILALVFSLMLPASLLTACAAEESETKSSIVTETVGDIRLQFLSPSLVRIEEKGPKGFEDRNTFHIVNRTDWDGDTVVIHETDTETIFTTTTAKVVVPKNSEISQVKIYDLKDVLIWEYRQLDSNKQDIPAFSEDVYAWQITDTPRIIPSEWGFDLMPEGAQLDYGTLDTNGWDLTNDAEDVYVFLPENDHRQLREDFVNLTGRTEMLSLAAFGAWDSRWYAYSEESALQQIDDYHGHDLPLDVLVIDTDWRNAANGMGYDIATNYFPDMERFLQRAHDKNVLIMFNDHPEPTLNGGNQNDVLKQAEVLYRQTNLQKLLNMGLDGWWYDRNWTSTVKPLDGFTHEVMGMATYHAAQKAVYPDDRLFMMSNVDGDYNGRITGASNIAAHRYGIEWTGDTMGYQETIWQEIEAALTFGEISALPYVSTDVYVHQTMSTSITDNEYIRWTQFGVLSPIFRPHVTGGDTGRMPWLRGEAVTDIFREYVNLRYRLLPVFYQLSHENYETGMPMLRPMTADYPEYAGADRMDQYLLGEDILIAPVINGGRYEHIPAEFYNGSIRAEFYNNKNLSGTPATTTTVNDINFDWGQNAPNSYVGADNFSARLTGSFTVPAEADVRLTLRSDDGCKLYVDGELVIDSWRDQEGNFTTEQTFAAGTTHEFTLEYFDSGSNARLRLGMVGSKEVSDERSVWIPEGRWINTFSGEEIYGPTTITIRSELDDMPIFVKAGAVIPLADETLTTADGDWSHITLDVYPSASVADTTELYEDDTKSTAYEDGKFRTTKLSTGFDAAKKQATLTIGAAQGEFDGELCFDSRDWTVRVHQPKGWGELTAVTDANGKAVTFKKIAADASAMPLNNDGASPDSAVYEIELSADVGSEQKLYFTFETPAFDVTEGEFELPKYYGTDSTLAVDRTVTVSDVPNSVNLSEEGTIDWIYGGYKADETETRKSADYEYIRFTNTVKDRQILRDHKSGFSWDSSADGSIGTNVHNGLYTLWYDDNYKFNVTATKEEQILTLYVGGYSSYGRMTISDGTKSGTTVLNFGQSSGSYYKKVEIALSAQKDTELNIEYACVSGENITFSAATLRKQNTDEEKAVEVTRSISVNQNMPASVDLSAEGTGDWLSGHRVNGALVRKAGVTPAIRMSSTELADMDDYHTGFSWNDGTANAMSNQHSGVYHWGGEMIITVPVSTTPEVLKLYLGGWQSKSKLEIYDDTGKQVDTYEFEDLSQSYYRVVTIQMWADEPTYLYCKYTRSGGGGNSTFAGATFTGTAFEIAGNDAPVFSEENHLYMSSGRYESGSWTADEVKIGLSAAYPEKVEKYQMKQDGKWVDLESGDVRIEENGSYDLAFRYVDKDGKFSDERAIQVNIDNTVPALNITKTGDGSNLTFAADASQGASVYYRADGGRWILMRADVTVPVSDGNTYRFKAVSATGIESDVITLDSEPAAYIAGDVDMNSKVDVADIMKLKALIMADTWSAEELTIGDMDNSKRLDVGDIMAVKNVIMSK